MTRMYVALAIIFMTGSLFAQQGSRPVDDQTEQMQKRLKMREEMHRRMMDKLINGVGPDQDMFKDMEQFMNDVMSDSFTGFDSLTEPRVENYKMDWSESAAGRTLNITPKTPEQQLDINVSNGLIIIKGKVEDKRPNGIAVSNFTNSFNVPGDCDPGKVKMSQDKGKILVYFPWRTAKPADIKPKPPSKSDVTI